MGSGSLIHVTKQFGVVLTNWHVVRNAPGAVEVVFPNGAHYQATVMKMDKTWDLAALAIWRPDVEPITIANQAPQPGEPLTIAGYGSGTYREATGRFTQFVAPSQKHSFEMVELSAEARQGDSGGPILNARGELTGVLLGAGHGATIGSYCGRVEIFLADVTPLLDAPTELIATAVDPPPPPTAVAATDRGVVAEPKPPTSPIKRAFPIEEAVTKQSPHHPPAVEPPVEPPWMASVEQPAPKSTNETNADFYRPAFVSPRPHDDAVSSSNGSPPNEHDEQIVRLTDVIGETTGEQIKSVLAAIGALSLLICSVRLVGGPVK
jgi:hypothetical protein